MSAGRKLTHAAVPCRVVKLTDSPLHTLRIVGTAGRNIVVEPMRAIEFRCPLRNAGCRFYETCLGDCERDAA